MLMLNGKTNLTRLYKKKLSEQKKVEAASLVSNGAALNLYISQNKLLE